MPQRTALRDASFGRGRSGWRRGRESRPLAWSCPPPTRTVGPVAPSRRRDALAYVVVADAISNRSKMQQKCTQVGQTRMQMSGELGRGMPSTRTDAFGRLHLIYRRQLYRLGRIELPLTPPATLSPIDEPIELI